MTTRKSCFLRLLTVIVATSIATEVCFVGLFTTPVAFAFAFDLGQAQFKCGYGKQSSTGGLPATAVCSQGYGTDAVVRCPRSEALPSLQAPL